MALRAGRVGVNPSEVDDLGHVTSGGMTPEERARLDKTLVTPITTPTEKEIVGVGTANEQIMFKLGDGLSVSGETSPFTLKTAGGADWETVFNDPNGKTSGFDVNVEAGKTYRISCIVYISGTVHFVGSFEFSVPDGFTNAIRTPVCFVSGSGSDFAFYSATVGSNGKLSQYPAFSLTATNKLVINSSGSTITSNNDFKITKIERK